MVFKLIVGEKSYRVDSATATDISIPLSFQGAQLNLYGVPKATAVAYRDDAFVGDTRLGGSSNFEVYNLITHCHVTHTECVGHISNARIHLLDLLAETMVPCTLITVEPVRAELADEPTCPVAEPDDLLITQELLASALSSSTSGFLEAVVLRTLPNDEGKRRRKYGSSKAAPSAPYLTLAAVALLLEYDVRHLVVDLPSVDRMYDEGLMTVHHRFWEVAAGTHEVDPDAASLRTITELAYVPDSLRDGPYLLSLQVAPFLADAAPSRPLLYPVEARS